MAGNLSVLTVGHSTLSYERFLSLLRTAGVTAVADVRSGPYSRRYPHFNKDDLRHELRADGIAYAFLGEELGGRPKEERFFCDGVANYDTMKTSPLFNRGIDRVMNGADQHRLALMCSEHNPLDCHRCLLVGRALNEKFVHVAHILNDGNVSTQEEIEKSLLEELKSENLFEYTGDILASAYRLRARKVAYRKPMTHSVAVE